MGIYPSSILQWIRWMQVVEGATFLILSVWLAASAALFYITVLNVSSDGMPALLGNLSSVPAPDLSLNAMAASGTDFPVALGFSMLGLSVSCIEIIMICIVGLIHTHCAP